MSAVARVPGSGNWNEFRIAATPAAASKRAQPAIAMVGIFDLLLYTDTDDDIYDGIHPYIHKSDDCIFLYRRTQRLCRTDILLLLNSDDNKIRCG